MTINIAQKLNTHMLNMAIEGLKNTPDFKLESTYLIMSNETLNSLKDDRSVCLNGVSFHQYRGIKIAVCDALNFGEIEIVKGYRNY